MSNLLKTPEWERGSAEFAELLGKTLFAIDGGKGDREMAFVTSEGEVYGLYHDQDCCESVEIDDIVGDVMDLIGSPILRAEERSSRVGEGRVDPDFPEYKDESFTWTFYELATIKGSVTIRWYGSSNGYYGESVDFYKEPKREE